MKRHISSLYKVAARSPGRTPCFPDITRHSNPFGWCLRLLIWSIYICIWSCPGSSIPYPCGIKWVVVVPQKVTFDIETSWPSPWLTLSLTPWPTPCPTHDRPHIWPHDWPHVWLHNWPHERLHYWSNECPNEFEMFWGNNTFSREPSIASSLSKWSLWGWSASKCSSNVLHLRVNGLM